MVLLENEDAITSHSTDTLFHRKKLLALALSESYMARFNPEKLKSSSKLLKNVFINFPDYLDYADSNLLHNLIFLKSVAYHMKLGKFDDFDTEIEAIGKKLLEEDNQNPYSHSYLGTFYASKENTQKAKYHFEQIVEAENFSENWYTKDARLWLNNN